MGYIVLLLISALLAGGSIVALDLPSAAVACLVLWPMYTGMLYLCLSGLYATIDGVFGMFFPSMKIKGDTHNDGE